MVFRLQSRSFALACVLSLTIACIAAAEEETENWPQEWYEPFKSASDIGLTEFHQSPYLDDKGLPPVKDRLPKDPIVVYPLKETGKYGGTAQHSQQRSLAVLPMGSCVDYFGGHEFILPQSR